MHIATAVDDAQPPRPSRRTRDREQNGEPLPTDIAERVVAFQRRHAVSTRPKERSERLSARPLPPSPPSPPPKPPTQPPPPQVVVSRMETSESEDTSRRRKLQTVSPRSRHSKSQLQSQSRLFNPNADSIPIRRTAEPESISDNGSSSYVPRAGLQPKDAGNHGRLFDHRKDDPVRFHHDLTRPSPARGDRPTPTPKSSGEYVSASSTSSYAHSIASSNFTLSSTTDGSSASSFSFFENQRKEESVDSAFSIHLKKLYRAITNLETKLQEDGQDALEEGRITLKKPNEPVPEAEDAEMDRWGKFVVDHKRLADNMHTLLRLTAAPNVPTSLRKIPEKYNIIVRLWTNGFNRPLENLRRSSFQSLIALEHLQDFIIYAYEFYSMLLEEHNLDEFRPGWLEALGDLARYRMAIAAMTSPVSKATEEGFVPISEHALSSRSEEGEPLTRIDDSPGPSVGVAAARALELEPERERWRSVAQDWYAAGLVSNPGTGKLHHHLGLLSRDADGEELQAIYHFVKSMTTLHEFMMSRESVLPIWSVQAQSRRALPDASVSDLFVLLHGMLFTNIQLDDFAPALARFMERLELEGAEGRQWIMMAVINITSVLEYGKPKGLLRKSGVVGSAAGKNAPTAEQAAAASAKVNLVLKKLDEMEVDDDDDGERGEEKMKDKEATVDINGNGILNVFPSMTHKTVISGQEAELPVTFKNALELTFTMFAYTLRNPLRKTNSFARPSLNPYITTILTFLAIVLKHKAVLPLLERAIPWEVLAAFLLKMPSGVLNRVSCEASLTSKTTPLPEDWCLRGMEWVTRRLYERGFWIPGKDRHVEMEVLSTVDEEEGATDGVIEDEDEDEETKGPGELGELGRRAVRVVRAAVSMAQVVPGFEWERGTKNWRVTGVLEDKVKRWREEERLQREEEERRRSRRPWADADEMDVDDEDETGFEDLSEDSESDEEDSEEVKALKARRRELRRMLQSSRTSGSPPRRRRRPRRSRNSIVNGINLRMVAGYTVLVIDTNILLSSLSIFSSLVESLQWTIVVPLAVITELDGLASNATAIGENASAAIAYITAHLRSHSLSLKVQTSKGNYLSTLTVRSEVVDFNYDAWERNMDDLILRAAVWQDDHWVDRSVYLKAPEERQTNGAAKVVLLSFDRNLRLKARARHLDAADEKDMAVILKTYP